MGSQAFWCGCPRLRPVRVGNGRRIRNYLRYQSIRNTIPRLSNEPEQGSFSRDTVNATPC